LIVRLHEQRSKGAVERDGVEGLRIIEDVERLINGVKEAENGAEIGFWILLEESDWEEAYQRKY
jgi:hypothetical protein